MKKILHIISQYPGRTGSGIYFNELIREANKKNYSQAIIGAIDQEEYKNPYIKEENTYLLEFNTERLPFYILGMSDEMPYRSKKYSDLKDKELNIYIEEFKKIIKKAIEEFKPSIIITHHLWLVSSLVKELARDIKVVGLSHGTDIRQILQNKRFEKQAIEGNRKLDLVLALNEEEKNRINKIYKIDKDKILVIGGGYNEDIFYPNFKNQREKVRLVYAGKISYAKGLLSIMRSIANLDRKYKVDFILVGSGDGEQYKKIKEKALRVNRNIEFLGEVRQEKVGEIFRGADIFLMPSYYEGLSLVTIEALASGLLVVSNKIRGLKSYLGDEINKSGVIKYVDGPKLINIDKPIEEDLERYELEFKNEIEKQIENLSKREEIYKNIEKSMKNLSWGKIFEKIEEKVI